MNWKYRTKLMWSCFINAFTAVFINQLINKISLRLAFLVYINTIVDLVLSVNDFFLNEYHLYHSTDLTKIKSLIQQYSEKREHTIHKIPLISYLIKCMNVIYMYIRISRFDNNLDINKRITNLSIFKKGYNMLVLAKRFVFAPADKAFNKVVVLV